MKALQRCIFLIFFAGLQFSATAQRAATGRTDITKTDFTKLPGFDCLQADFRGLHLGMSKKEAVEALAKLTHDYTWEYDRFNTVSEDAGSLGEMRIYVSLKNSSLKDPAVLYLLWDDGSPGMSSMVFYRPARQWLAGNAALLFNESALKPGDAAMAFAKGTPLKETSNIDLTTYSYPAQHFQLIYMPGMMGLGADVWFKFLK